jgi:hypothetical protein
MNLQLETMETVVPRQQPVKTSRFCRPFNWSQGDLNDSTYKAFCKFAGHVLDQHSTAARGVLREVAHLIECAGDSVKKDKLIEQFFRARLPSLPSSVQRRVWARWNLSKPGANGPNPNPS